MSKLFDDNFKSVMARDLFRLVVGKKLGKGIGREVYEYNLNKDYVIKFEANSGSFQNVLEWEFWNRNKYNKEVAKWLAPCKFISPCGTILVQEKTTPVTNKELPDLVPGWMTDLKVDNFGRIGKRIVVHDYAYHCTRLPMRLKKNYGKDT